MEQDSQKKKEKKNKKNKKRRFRRPRLPQVVYLLFLLAAVIYVSNRGGAFSYALFYTAVGYPVLAFFYLLYSRATLRLNQELAFHEVKKNLGTPCLLELENAGVLPIAGMTLYAYDERGSFSEQISGRELSLLPKDKIVFDMTLNCKYAGHYAAGIKKIMFRDCFDILRLTMKTPAPLFVRVLPVVNPESSEAMVREFLERSAGASGGRTHEQESILGNDLAPYMPGDPLKRIHWKNYARSGELLVRLPEEKDIEMFSVVLQARPMKDQDEAEESEIIRDLARRDRFLDTAVSVASYFAEQKKPVQFLFYNMGAQRFLVEDYEGLRDLTVELSKDLVLRGDMERANQVLSEEAERWQCPVLTLTEEEGELAGA